MGQKVHPVGFRLGITRTWDARWYSDRSYTALLHEDLAIRQFFNTRMADAGIARVEIERSANNVTLTVHSAKPGIVIGRSGARVEQLRKELEGLTGKRVRVNITEIRFPETDAYLIARGIAEQIGRRVSYKRAIKQALTRAMQRGVKGIKIVMAGRLGGSEMSRRERDVEGKVPLHTLRADIDYGQTQALTLYGAVGIKVWVYRGEILPPRREPPLTTAVGSGAEAGV